MPRIVAQRESRSGLQVVAPRADGSRAMTPGSRVAGDSLEARLEDLRAPLDSMLAYLDLLLDEEMSEAERRRFLEVVRSSAARARRLADGRPT
jgi:signal transduction histidine kinase